MAGPSWLGGPLAAVMIATSVYCVSRLAVAWRSRRPAEHDVDAAHVLMGVAMAGMLVPRLNPFGSAGWEVIFGIVAAWFGARAARQYLGQRTERRQGGHHVHHVHHLLATGAMLYMLACTAAPAGIPAAAAGAAGMAGMAGSPAYAAGFPSLTLGLALVLFAGVIWAVDRILTAPAPVAVTAAEGPVTATAAGNPVTAAVAAGRPAGPARPPMSPRLAACCEIVMGVTMSYMLITML